MAGPRRQLAPSATPSGVPLHHAFGVVPLAHSAWEEDRAQRGGGGARVDEHESANENHQ